MTVEELNRRRYNKGEGKLVCTKCSFEVSLDDSYSNKGQHVICRKCLFAESKKLGIDVGKYLQKYIWSEKPWE